MYYETLKKDITINEVSKKRYVTDEIYNRMLIYYIESRNKLANHKSYGASLDKNLDTMIYHCDELVKAETFMPSETYENLKTAFSTIRETERVLDAVTSDDTNRSQKTAAINKYQQFSRKVPGTNAYKERKNLQGGIKAVLGALTVLAGICLTPIIGPGSLFVVAAGVGISAYGIMQKANAAASNNKPPGPMIDKIANNLSNKI